MLDTMAQHFRGLNKEKVLKSFDFRTFLQIPQTRFGGDKRDRTADLLNAIQALSQLSYTPELLDGGVFSVENSDV